MGVSERTVFYRGWKWEIYADDGNNYREVYKSVFRKYIDGLLVFSVNPDKTDLIILIFKGNLTNFN